MKSFTPIAFPESDHPDPPPPPHPLAAAQRAFPEASEVRTYPFEAPERILIHWNDHVPATTRRSLSPLA